MKSDACVARLEKKLSLDKQRVIQCLNAVVAGLVEELVQKEEIAVKGLGYFKVVHIPFRKKAQDNVTRALPPRKQIVFLTRPVVDSATLRIIARKTGLTETEAEKFYRILAGHFRDTFGKKQELCLEGLGTFGNVDGKYIFVPDRTLQEIVNNAYENLQVLEVHVK